MRFEAVVGDGQRDYTEVHRIFEDGIENARVVGALDADGDVRIITFELRENLGEDVQASAFICADDDFAAGNALGFGDLSEDGFAAVESLLGILEK